MFRPRQPTISYIFVACRSNLIPCPLYFQMSDEPLFFHSTGSVSRENETRIDWNSPIAIDRSAMKFPWGGKCSIVARYVHGTSITLIWRDAYRRDVHAERRKGAKERNEYARRARCINMMKLAIRWARFVPHEAAEAEHQRLLLSLADNGYPRNSRHRCVRD